MSYLAHEHLESVLTDYVAKLDALGSADAIALHLEDHEVRAFCGSRYKCAVAEDLRTELRAHGIISSNISVNKYTITVDAYTAGKVQLNTTPPIGTFIDRFDIGVYGELVHPLDRAGTKKVDARKLRGERYL